jgi:putative membrane protein
MAILVHLGVLTLTVLALARFVPGIRVKNPVTAVLVALVFSGLNVLLGKLISVVLVIGTLGIAWLVLPFLVNTILLWATDKALKNFSIEDLRSLLISSGVITVVSWIVRLIVRQIA